MAALLTTWTVGSASSCTTPPLIQPYRCEQPAPAVRTDLRELEESGEHAALVRWVESLVLTCQANEALRR